MKYMAVLEVELEAENDLDAYRQMDDLCIDTDGTIRRIWREGTKIAVYTNDHEQPSPESGLIEYGRLTRTWRGPVPTWANPLGEQPSTYVANL